MVNVCKYDTRKNCKIKIDKRITHCSFSAIFSFLQSAAHTKCHQMRTGL